MDINKDQSYTFNIDDGSFKSLDKKEFIVKLKKKKFLWGREDLDEKKFRVHELSSKCETVKDIKACGNATYQLKFSLHTPTKQKDYEEVKTEKLVIDSYLQPFRDNE